MKQPLWIPTNKTVFSSVFSVSSGQVCVLVAANFAEWAHRTAPIPRVPQTACIRTVLHKFTAAYDNTHLRCDWIFDIDQIRADQIVDELVRTCGLPWQLSMCRNIGVLGVPGTYRLELNDSTAVGVAQVYAEIFSAQSFPVQTKDLFF